MAISYLCTADRFQGVETTGIIQFEAHSNLKMLYDFLKDFGGDGISFSQLKEALPECGEDWEEYILVGTQLKILSRAAILKSNKFCWEVAAVSTAPQYRSRGYATMMVSYCTRKILESERAAVLTTAEDNWHMRKTAEKLGYVLSPVVVSGEMGMEH